MKRSIVSNKIESIESAIKRTANKKNSGRDRLTGEFYQTFVCVCVYSLLKLLQKLKRKEHFYKASITLIPKPDKHTHIHTIAGQDSCQQ